MSKGSGNQFQGNVVFTLEVEIPANIYLFKPNNRKTRKKSEIWNSFVFKREDAREQNLENIKWNNYRPVKLFVLTNALTLINLNFS